MVYILLLTECLQTDTLAPTPCKHKRKKTDMLRARSPPHKNQGPGVGGEAVGGDGKAGAAGTAGEASGGAVRSGYGGGGGVMAE